MSVLPPEEVEAQSVRSAEVVHLELDRLERAVRAGSEAAIRELYRMSNKACFILLTALRDELPAAVRLAQFENDWPVHLPFIARARQTRLSCYKPLFDRIGAGTKAYSLPERLTTIKAHGLATQFWEHLAAEDCRVRRKPASLDVLFKDAWNAVIPEFEAQSGLVLEDNPLLTQGLLEECGKKYEEYMKRHSSPGLSKKGLPGEDDSVSYKPRGHLATDKSRIRERIKHRIRTFFDKEAEAECFHFPYLIRKSRRKVIG